LKNAKSRLTINFSNYFVGVVYMFSDIEMKVANIFNKTMGDDTPYSKMNVIIENDYDTSKIPSKRMKRSIDKTENKHTSNMVCENNVSNVNIDENGKSQPTKCEEHTNAQFVCEICNYKTDRKFNYNKHLLSLSHKKRNKIKLDNTFCCNLCDYFTNRKKDYDKHMNTKKHLSNITVCKNKNNNNNNMNNKLLLQQFLTDKDNNKIDINLLKDDITSIIIKEIKNMNEQNKLLLDVANKQTTINNNQTNNQQFNLNMFLNETCKDAMNLSDFLENMHVSMEDMEKTGELGFAKGMSRIIINNLNALDVCKRPIHCSDVKRETLYVKNNGVWEKETEDRKRTKEIIYKASRLNLKELLKWRDLPRNKGYDKSDHTKNDEFTNLVMEINKMREEEFDKIITSVSKHVAIDKVKDKVKMSGYLN